MGTYAKNTSVTIEQSRADIQSVLARFGAHFEGFVDEPGRVIVMFHGKRSWVQFKLSLPVGPHLDQQRRELWRALYLGIKGKLVCVASGIETFEQAFYAHLVMESGKTVSEELQPALKQLPKRNWIDE